MVITFQPTGSWSGRKQLWLHPEAAAEVSDASLEISAYEIAYRWSHRNKPQTGVIRLRSQDGSIEFAWRDTFHTIDEMVLRGFASDDLLVANGSYPDGRGGPDWGWRIEISRSGPPQIRMFNITPSGEEALAVVLRAES